MPKRVLYQFTLSPYCTKVRWALEHKRLEYDAVEVDPFTRREARDSSGQKKVPVLRDGETVIADSTPILRHLEANYPQGPLLSADPAVRARQSALEDWADEVFTPDLIGFKIYSSDNARRMVERTAKHHEPTLLTPLQLRLGPSVVRWLGRSRRRGRPLAALQAAYERHLDLLNGMTGERAPYLTGETPCVFDAAVWGALWTMKGKERDALLERRPALAAWFKRMRAEI
jgi:glutathione S-transferase